MISREEATSHGDRIIAFSREFDAPREDVFRAWTDPTLWARWFAPEPMSGRAQTDPRPGGRYTFVMIDEDGRDYPSVGEYREVVEPERIVYTDSSAEMPDDFVAMVNELRGAEKDATIADGIATVTFDDVGNGRTRMTFSEEFDSRATRDAWIEMQMVEGFDAGLDQLERVLAEQRSMAR